MLGVPQDAWAAGPVSACSSVHVYSAAQAAPHQGDTAGGTAPASELSTAPAPTFSLSTNPTADSTQVWRHIMLHRDHSADRKEYDPESIAREQKVALLLAVSYHSSCSYYWPLFLLLAPTPTTGSYYCSYYWLLLMAPTTGSNYCSYSSSYSSSGDCWAPTRVLPSEGARIHTRGSEQVRSRTSSI